jgi:2-dehydro-3-deoxyglucarate aldolase/4-hydroxy-2-oxoheptanedioate aldolase
MYPPKGIRGVAASPRAAGFAQDSMNYLTQANDEIFIMIAIETATAIENLNSILEVEELDGIFIGPMDLSTSMGHMGDTEHPDVLAAISEVEDIVLSSGKVLATNVSNWDQAKKLYDRGYQMVMLMADGVDLGKLAAKRVREFKNHFPKG